MSEEFYRIRRLPPYVFAEVNAMKAAARADGEDIIDLGMGNPDGSPPAHVIDTPIQAAATAALNGPQDIVAANRALYKRRRDVLVESFGRAGWDIPVPEASMFAWAPIPPALADIGSVAFAKDLLTHAGVAVAPGAGFGEEGEGYVRLALVENEQRIRQAARGLKRYLVARGVTAPVEHEAASA